MYQPCWPMILLAHDQSPTHSERGVEDVVKVDGQEIEEPLRASSGNSVTGVVNVCPGVGTLSKTAVC